MLAWGCFQDLQIGIPHQNCCAKFSFQDHFFCIGISHALWSWEVKPISISGRSLATGQAPHLNDVCMVDVWDVCCSSESTEIENKMDFTTSLVAQLFLFPLEGLSGKICSQPMDSMNVRESSKVHSSKFSNWSDFGLIVTCKCPHRSLILASKTRPRLCQNWQRFPMSH